ncbi:hypothetical protein K461DRAFT_135635 [Myriangium duriaei CBS 260.36]|uniref:Uncharacterized protein n=1 Tax=Myriangium duriaei CBS 260.36 TaxID=1168546 RepID=A0A9P4J098_9PEZI|nr:hypothetical protein K461DRAFT_135635 [Myriangium duriaei CBS 260.36]
MKLGRPPNASQSPFQTSARDNDRFLKGKERFMCAAEAKARQKFHSDLGKRGCICKMIHSPHDTKSVRLDSMKLGDYWKVTRVKEPEVRQWLCDKKASLRTRPGCDCMTLESGVRGLREDYSLFNHNLDPYRLIGAVQRENTENRRGDQTSAHQEDSWSETQIGTSRRIQRRTRESVRCTNR